jgi:hypothetical protein
MGGGSGLGEEEAPLGGGDGEGPPPPTGQDGAVAGNDALLAGGTPQRETGGRGGPV